MRNSRHGVDILMENAGRELIRRREAYLAAGGGPGDFAYPDLIAVLRDWGDPVEKSSARLHTRLLRQGYVM